MHPYIKILGRMVPTYSLCIFAGIVLAVPVLIFLSRRFQTKIEDSLYSLIYSFIGLIVGAKLFFLILNIKSIPEIVSRYGFLALMQGGFVIYGGLAGAFLGAFIYCRQFHLQCSKIFSLLITVTPLIQGCGRIGCLFAGCCYGIHYRGPISITLAGASRFPVQILNSALDFILFGALLIRCLFSSGRLKNFPLYLLCYSLGRFLTEFLRGDAERMFLGPLSTSQWISILFFVSGIVLLILPKKSTVPADSNTE